MAAADDRGGGGGRLRGGGAPAEARDGGEVGLGGLDGRAADGGAVEALLHAAARVKLVALDRLLAAAFAAWKWNCREFSDEFAIIPVSVQ